MKTQPRAAAPGEKPQKQTMSRGGSGSGWSWHVHPARESRAGRPCHLLGNRTAILAFGFMLLLVGGPAGGFFGGPFKGQGLGYSQRRSAKTRTAPVEVPFEFLHNQVIVEVRIAGKGPFSMLVDTNTDPSAIDLATAKELGLVLGSTRLPTVELGSVIAKDVVASGIDLSKLSGRFGKPIHGVLGYSFLRDRIIQIDYPATKIRFYTESPYPGIQDQPNTVDKIALAFKYEEGVLVDSVFINGQKMKATLDTGSSGTFSLTPEAISDLNLEEQAQNGEGEKPVGSDGEFESKSGVLKSVRMGRLSIDSAPATFWLPGTGHDKKKFQVNIGNGFFKDFIMTFDFRGKVVVLERVE